MNEWIKSGDAMHPVTPWTEVLVWVDGHRGPSWRNNYHLVAYMDRDGFWREERHPFCEPLVGVLAWMPLPEPPNV